MPPMDEHVLSLDEQKFFETGQLQPGMVPEEPPVIEPPPVPPPPAIATAPTPPAETPTPPPDHNAETDAILRQSLEAAHQRVGELQASIEALQTQQRTPAEAPAPDPNTDPLGHLLHKLDTMNKAVTDMQAQLSQQREQQTQITQFEQFKNSVNTLREEFAKTHTDFGDAYQHLRAARIADLKEYGVSPQEIQKALLQEEVVLSQNAMKLGKNPAEVVYEMAKRHGYVPKATPPAAAPAADKLSGIHKAQEASKTLPSTPQLEDITVEGLKSASEDDLNKLVHDPKMWAKITNADQYPL